MIARDVMQTSLVTVGEQDTAARVVDLFQEMHVHSAPVVDARGQLVGMVSQEDILIGSMSVANRPVDLESDRTGLASTLVKDIMTAPAIHATAETSVRDLGRMMWRFRIHHIPIVRSQKNLEVIGIVSALDLCRMIADHPGGEG